MKREITTEDLQKFETSFDSSRVNKVAMNAAVQAGVNGAARNYAVQQNNPYSFSIEVEAGKVCDQKSSGRCWMFAALNVMRLDLMEKLNLDSMELSQNYPLFYDKLEKANYFLENMLETLDEPRDGRVVSFLLKDPPWRRRPVGYVPEPCGEIRRGSQGPDAGDNRFFRDGRASQVHDHKA